MWEHTSDNVQILHSFNKMFIQGLAMIPILFVTLPKWPPLMMMQTFTLKTPY